MPCAVITGSSSGIGLATARRLVKLGYSVVLHGHTNIRGMQTAAQELKSDLASGQSIHCITANISYQHACRQMVQTCFAWHPKIDLWVNNAGADVLTGTGSESSFDSKMEKLWRVDVAGTILLSRLVAQRMQSAGASVGLPCIINTGWDQATLGMEGDAGQLFCCVKAAISAFSTALALTVAPQVRVNTIAPGWIQTAWGQQQSRGRWHQRAIEESQLGRWGKPEDVAEAICWLASPAASFVNGQTIAVNGGRRYYVDQSPQNC